MGFLITLSAILDITFVALLIYTITQSKDSVNKKELTQSIDIMAPLGYTFSRRFSSTPSHHYQAVLRHHSN